MIYYTKKGDLGYSYLTKNKRVKKSNYFLEILGELDEINSFLGILKNQTFLNKEKEIKKIILNIQEDFFIIQAEIAAKLLNFKNKNNEIKLKKEKIFFLEKIIDEKSKKFPLQKKFAIPGANLKSAYFDYTRTIVRRLERKLVVKNRVISKNILAYINRLSSLFYVLARYFSYQAKKKERNPKYQ